MILHELLPCLEVISCLFVHKNVLVPCCMAMYSVTTAPPAPCWTPMLSIGSVEPLMQAGTSGLLLVLCRTEFLLQYHIQILFNGRLQVSLRWAVNRKSLTGWWKGTWPFNFKSKPLHSHSCLPQLRWDLHRCEATAHAMFKPSNNRCSVRYNTVITSLSLLLLPAYYCWSLRGISRATMHPLCTRFSPLLWSGTKGKNCCWMGIVFINWRKERQREIKWEKEEDGEGGGGGGAELESEIEACLSWILSPGIRALGSSSFIIINVSSPWPHWGVHSPYPTDCLGSFHIISSQFLLIPQWKKRFVFVSCRKYMGLGRKGGGHKFTEDQFPILL